jgi:hypothetical protein
LAFHSLVICPKDNNNRHFQQQIATKQEILKANRTHKEQGVEKKI